MGSRLRHLVLLSLVLLAGACGKFATYQPTRVEMHGNRNVLYSATMRVFLLRGWSLETNDPYARVVATPFMPIQELDPLGRKLLVSYRVLVNTTTVEVFTGCRVAPVGPDCPPDQRPEATQAFEQQLLREIVSEAQKLWHPQAAQLPIAAQPPEQAVPSFQPAPEPPPAGSYSAPAPPAYPTPP